VPEFLIYDQDTCIGSVTADTKEAAWELAKQRLQLTDDTPAYLQELRPKPESNHQRGPASG
jgi:hypothetical protein